MGNYDDNVIAVYERLKDRYDLVLTTSSELDEGFTIDCPVIVGKRAASKKFLKPIDKV